GLVLIAPDTSPRNTGIEGATKDWDFGEGAGFCIDATQSPWSKHFRMESWIVHELLPTVIDRFNVDLTRVGITGHSMGGHGALTLAMKHRSTFKSVSALAPIAAPTHCPWGEKAFDEYLGPDRQAWRAHDACELLSASHCPFPNGILVDQGLGDKFMVEQLKPELLEGACGVANQPLTLRRHAGYDHGYYFVASFIADHLRFHAAQLNA
ncbi:MAG: S-formylglutathione hydrolase, partial [Betaproteobacteria bacterium]|nr:S-formylglutathione hydrolase [Betaproteobacteria bacterium]